MSYIASAILGAGALGAGASIWGANKAASAQTSAANAGISAQTSMFNQGLGTLQSLLKSGIGSATDIAQPFISGGKGAMDTLTSLLTPGENMTDVLSKIPGFQFAQDWGQKGVSAQATTRGLGGNAIAAGGQYATGLAQQGFGGLISGLQGLLGTGAGVAGNLSSGILSASAGAGNNILSGSNTAGGNIANLTAGIGNAQAGGAIGTANAIGGLGNSAVNATLLSKLLGNSGGSLGAGGLGLPTGAATGGLY